MTLKRPSTINRRSRLFKLIYFFFRTGKKQIRKKNLELFYSFDHCHHVPRGGKFEGGEGRDEDGGKNEIDLPPPFSLLFFVHREKKRLEEGIITFYSRVESTNFFYGSFWFDVNITQEKRMDH